MNYYNENDAKACAWLRELMQFASAALQGFLASGEDRLKSEHDIIQLAPTCFALADAMLRAREKK